MTGEYTVVSWLWVCDCDKTHRTILIGDAHSHKHDALAFRLAGVKHGIVAGPPIVAHIDVDDLEALLGPELGLT